MKYVLRINSYFLIHFQNFWLSAPVQLFACSAQMQPIYLKNKRRIRDRAWYIVG